MLLTLLVTGVIGAIAAILLTPVFGKSTNGGYHNRHKRWTNKEKAALLKLGKIGAAGLIATIAAPVILAASPFLIFALLIGGVVLVLHHEIPQWRIL